MPLYEFFCRDCSQEFELLVRPGDALICETCGSERLEKLLSIPAAHSTSASLSGEACAMPQPPAGGPCGSGCGCFPSDA
ncbi:MAG: zinc ribbon domain-containing protein [Planctomycetota bacterium]